MPIREDALKLSTYNARFNIQELQFAYQLKVWCYSHKKHLFSLNSFNHFLLAVEKRVCSYGNF